MILALFLVLLGTVAIFPFVVVAINSFDGSFLDKLTQSLNHYDSIFLSVGTILTISGLAVLTAKIASNSVVVVERENRKNRVEMSRIQLKTAKEIKIAEFRQAWINDLRRDAAEYVSLYVADIMSGNFNDEKRRERLSVLSTQIYLMLNPDEDLSERLAGCIRRLAVARREQNVQEIQNLLREFSSISRDILKGEWSRLKNELDQAITTESITP